MKIGIVTVYESLNCGAYLQAWALKEFLQNEGFEISFLKHNARNKLRIFLRTIIQLTLREKRDLRFFMKCFLNFSTQHKQFPLCYNADQMNAFILGSDEIWNVSKPDMRKFPLFWGIGLPDKIIISYAPSANNATREAIEAYPFSKEALDNMNAISVRDTHTKEIIENIANKPVSLVCDPTMLLNQDDYSNHIKPILEDNYILIYDCYKRFTDKEIAICQKFAREKEKILISFGANLTWCERSIPANPMLFLSYFKNADFIFTGTFHGVVYAMIFNKQFISASTSEKKVVRTLEFYGLESRMLKEENIFTILNTEIDYGEINKKIDGIRHTSKKFLRDALGIQA